MQARVHARDQRLLQPCVRAWHELTTPCANIHGPLHKCACARRFTHVAARVNSYVVTSPSFSTSSSFPPLFPIFLLLFFLFLFFFCFGLFWPFSLDLSPFPHRSISSSCLQAFSFYDAESSFTLSLSFCHSFLSLFLSKRPLLHIVPSPCHLSFYDTEPDLVFFKFLHFFFVPYLFFFIFFFFSFRPSIYSLAFHPFLLHTGKFVPLENGEELRYFFIMRILAHLVSILVSALLKGRSIFTVAEQRIRGKKKERWAVEIFSGRKSRAAINSPLKRNRSGTF